MAGAVSSTLGDLAKNIYEGAINSQRNDRYTCWGRSPKRDVGPGYNRYYAIRTGRITSMGASTESATQPVATTIGVKQGQWFPQNIKGTLSFTREILKLAKSEPAIFADKVDDDFMEFGTAWWDMHDVIILNDGSGTLGTVTSIADGGGVLRLSKTDVRKFHVGMELNAWTSRASGATAQYFKTTTTDLVATVTAVNEDAAATYGTITVSPYADGDTQISANDVLVRKNARTSIIGYEPPGISAIANNADPMPLWDMKAAATVAGLNGITVASTPAWKARVLTNSGIARPLTDTLLVQGIDSSNIRSAKSPDEFWVAYGVRSAFGNSTSSPRISFLTYDVKGASAPGFNDNEDAKDFIYFRNIPFIPNKYIAPVTASTGFPGYFVNNSAWEVVISDPMGFVDEDGSTFRTTDRTMTFEAWAQMLWTTKTIQRNAFVRIDDLAGTDPLAA